MGDHWQAGAFNTKCKRGDDDAYDVAVAGWIKGPFGLDFRAFYEPMDFEGYTRPQRGWCITHIPSGYVTQKVIGELPMAQDIAEQMMRLGGWEEIRPDNANDRLGEQMRQIRRALGDADGTSTACIGAVKA